MKTVSRRAAAVMSLLVVLTMVLAACGTAGSNTKSGKSVMTIVPSPYGSFTDNFNPFSSTANSGTQGLLYETLLFFNREQAGQVQPWLAQSYTWSNNGQTVTFKLRDGVTWSDGQPFTSADVVFTLNLLHQYPALDGNGLWHVISSVSAPDSSTVAVNFNQTSYTQLWYLAGQTYMVPQHVWQSVTDPVKYTDTNPVGTGPYTLGSFNPQLYVFEKNAHYWQHGLPKIDELRYPAYTSNTSADLLLNSGKVDWTGLFTPNIQSTYVAKNTKNNHYWFPPDNVVMLYLNDAKAPFNNVNVRKAISDVIDRQQLDNTGEDGYEPVASPTGLVLPTDQTNLAPQYASTNFSVNTSEATSLMQQAGYTMKNGLWTDSNGNTITFNIEVVTGWTDWVTDTQIMANELTQFGMKVSSTPEQFGTYFANLQQGSFMASISWTNPGPTAYYLYQSMLASTNTAPVGQTASSNFERWNDPTTDAALKAYAASNDPSVQQQALNTIQQVMVQQLPSIPLVYGATWNEYSTANVTGWPSASNPYAMPAPFSYPDVEVVMLHLQPAS